MLAILWVCFGLFSILTYHRMLLGTAQIVAGLGSVTNEILAKKAVSKKWRTLFNISAVIIFLAIGLGLFFGR